MAHEEGPEPAGPEQLQKNTFIRWQVLHERYGQGNGKPWRRIMNADDRRENAEVVRMMTGAAEQGHAQAQFFIGIMCTFGQGAPQSDALAVEWSRKAADQGSADAQCNLGAMYAHGRGGLPQSDALAVEWYRKARPQTKDMHPVSYTHLTLPTILLV